MPIVTVEIVARPDERLGPGAAEELAARIGDIFGSAPGGTWVKVQLIQREHYAENSSVAHNLYPVFVSVLKAKLPPPESLQAEAARLTTAVGELCGRPRENVHVVYSPEGAGRVAIGGKIVAG